VTRSGAVMGRPRTAERSRAFHVVDSLASKRGMTVESLASSAGIHSTTLYVLKDPKVSTVRKLATALGMKIGRLAELLSAAEDGDA
jgi:DNA-binding Xre family transcriptional regulator